MRLPFVHLLLSAPLCSQNLLYLALRIFTNTTLLAQDNVRDCVGLNSWSLVLISDPITAGPGSVSAPLLVAQECSPSVPAAGFRRKEFRGKLAIAITANFINRHTRDEARVEEISGVAFIFNQKFFRDLREATG